MEPLLSSFSSEFSDDPPACSVYTPLSTPLTTYPQGLLGLSRCLEPGIRRKDHVPVC